jgi:hypothetical protein
MHDHWQWRPITGGASWARDSCARPLAAAPDHWRRQLGAGLLAAPPDYWQRRLSARLLTAPPDYWQRRPGAWLLAAPPDYWRRRFGSWLQRRRPSADDDWQRRLTTGSAAWPPAPSTTDYWQRRLTTGSAAWLLAAPLRHLTAAAPPQHKWRLAAPPDYRQRRLSTGTPSANDYWQRRLTTGSAAWLLAAPLRHLTAGGPAPAPEMAAKTNFETFSNDFEAISKHTRSNLAPKLLFFEFSLQFGSKITSFLTFRINLTPKS